MKKLLLSTLLLTSLTFGACKKDGGTICGTVLSKGMLTITVRLANGNTHTFQYQTQAEWDSKVAEVGKEFCDK